MNEYPGAKSHRLGSWKEIAAHLGRDVRTVIRWEKERGLPVHRDSSGPGRPTVYANAEELDGWLLGHSEEAAKVPVPEARKSAQRGRLPRVVQIALPFSVLAALSVGAWQFTSRNVVKTLIFQRVDFSANVPMGVASGDFNGDGSPDIAFTNSTADTIEVIFGDGKGAFPRRVSIPESKEPERIAVADFNGDGVLDIAVTNKSSHDVTVLIGDGRSEFRETFRWPTGGRGRWITAFDMNHDGIMDLAVACSTAHKVAALLGRGDGTFDEITQYDTDGEPSSVIVGDFTQDKIPDLLVADYESSGGKTVSLYAGNGDGTFRARQPFPAGAGPLAVTSADFNGDGLLDIATANYRDGISVLAGTVEGFGLPQSWVARSAPGYITNGDVDGDGKLDLVMVAEHSNDLHLYLGDGEGGFAGSQILPAGTYPDSIAVADFNRDGRLDIVVGALYGNIVSVYLNEGVRE